MTCNACVPIICCTHVHTARHIYKLGAAHFVGSSFELMPNTSLDRREIMHHMSNAHGILKGDIEHRREREKKRRFFILP